MTGAPIAPQRRHTLYFLAETRAAVPVFLDTDVDMTRLLAFREAAGAADPPVRYSTVACVVHAASRVLARHPEANAALAGRRFPKVARYPAVNTKLTVDKTLDGQRIVLSAVLPAADTAGLERIQGFLAALRDADPAAAPEFAGARRLQRLGWPLGPLLLRLGTRSLARRAETVGTLAVTSLGHRPVDGFHSVGGTTVTLGLGQVAQRPAVRDGRIEIAPLMRLSLAFDHRVIDGAAAADLLADIKTALERFGQDESAGSGEPRAEVEAEASRAGR